MHHTGGTTWRRRHHDDAPKERECVPKGPPPGGGGAERLGREPLLRYSLVGHLAEDLSHPLLQSVQLLYRRK